MDYELLHEVSLIDKELIKLEREKINKDTVKELSILKKKHADLREVYKKESESQINLNNRTNQASKQIDEKTKERTVVESDLYNTSNLKNIDSFERHIEKLNNEIKCLEEEVYQALSSIDLLTTENEKLIQEINSIMSEYNELLRKYRKNQEDINEKIALLNVKRKNFMDNITKESGELYNGIKSEYGFGMSEVKGHICSGCNVDVPIVIINEVKYKKKLLRCPNCNRLLYISVD